MATAIPTALARAWRAQELLRLYHNVIGGKVGQAGALFPAWRAAGYPVGSAPVRMSQTQFDLWRVEWWLPRSMRLNDIIAPAKDAWMVARAAELGVTLRNLTEYAAVRAARETDATNDASISITAV